MKLMEVKRLMVIVKLNHQTTQAKMRRRRRRKRPWSRTLSLGLRRSLQKTKAQGSLSLFLRRNL